MDGRTRPVAAILWCLWPGLCRLWHEGQFVSLALAILASWSLSFLVFCSLVWTEVVRTATLATGWAVLATGWVAVSVWTWRCEADRFGGNQPDRGGLDLFLAARGEYLKGEWQRAEATLCRLVKHNRRDAEARLLLVTLLRHQRRVQEAARQLRRLQWLEAATRWRVEIEAEWRHLAGQRVADAKGRSQPTTDERPADNLPALRRAA